MDVIEIKGTIKYYNIGMKKGAVILDGTQKTLSFVNSDCQDFPACFPARGDRVLVFCKQYDTLEIFRLDFKTAIGDDVKQIEIDKAAVEFVRRIDSGIQNPSSYLEMKFWKEKSERRLIDSYSPVCFHTGIMDGTNECIGCGYIDRYQTYHINYIKKIQPFDAINFFADYYDYWNADNTGIYGFLDNMALKGEKWGFSKSEPYRILKSYIRYMFYRALMNGHVKTGKDHFNQYYSIFNTGLVDDNYNQIYGLFEQYKSSRLHPRHRFLAFTTYNGNGIFSEKIRGAFTSEGVCPKPEVFITDYNQIRLDPDLDISFGNIDHILIDHPDRWPIQTLREAAAENSEINSEIDKIYPELDEDDKNRLWDNVTLLIAEDKQAQANLRGILMNAVERSRKRALWSYRTAIPSYYPRKDEMALLIPLFLQGGTIALLLEPVMKKDKIVRYEAKTKLTTEQAYINSRIISRVDSDWLRIDQ